MNREHRWPSIPLVLFCAAITSGCLHDRAEGIAALEGDPASGEELFLKHCVGCHGTNARSGSADHDIVKHTKDDALGFIDEVLDGNFTMPSFEDRLNDQEVADILAYVSEL